MPGLLHAGLSGHFSKRSVVIVVIKKIVAIQIGDDKNRHSHRCRNRRRLRLCYMPRGQFPPCVRCLQRCRRRGSGIIAPGAASLATNRSTYPSLSISAQTAVCVCGGGFGQSGSGGYIGESSVAIIPQQRFALGKLPRAAQNQNVGASVIVVVGLDQVESAELSV